MATAEEREHDPAAAIAAIAGQRQRVDRAIGTAINPFLRDMLEGLEHHIDQAEDGLRIAAHRLYSRPPAVLPPVRRSAARPLCSRPSAGGPPAYRRIAARPPHIPPTQFCFGVVL